MSKNMAGIEAARKKRAEMVKAGVKAVRRTPLEKAADSPNSLRLAVSAKCFECEGGDADPHIVWRIGNCTVVSCPLHNVRPHKSLKGKPVPKSLEVSADV